MTLQKGVAFAELKKIFGTVQIDRDVENLVVNFIESAFNLAGDTDLIEVLVKINNVLTEIAKSSKKSSVNLSLYIRSIDIYIDYLSFVRAL